MVFEWGRKMDNKDLAARLKGLYTAAMVNAGIWAVALIALAVLLQKGGNWKGMYVILAAGTGVGIQIIASIAKLRKA
jgi:hypothetical protein